jgi:predicted Zn-dependent protease
MPEWLTRDLGVTAPTVEISALPGTPALAGEGSLDWLEGLEVDTSEIPQWLRQAIATSDTESVPTPPPSPAVVTAPQPVIVPAAPPPAPAAVTAPPAGLNVGELLSAARAALAGNNVQEALSGYEQVIRANSNLDEVIDDLTKLVDKVKTSAAAYRVLGDGLMRKGRLQDALDTYRKALNQL